MSSKEKTKEELEREIEILKLKLEIAELKRQVAEKEKEVQTPVPVIVRDNTSDWWRNRPFYGDGIWC